MRNREKKSELGLIEIKHFNFCVFLLFKKLISKDL